MVVVDADDRPIGTVGKLRAHLEGTLHRALSVFVFHPNTGMLLLQKRAADKYHSGGLWSNSCCSHPRPGEALADAAHRRLREELGFDCELEFALTVGYRLPVGPSLVENEITHVFTGEADVEPAPDPTEVADVRWIGVPEVVRDLAAHPERYSPWFGVVFAELLAAGFVSAT